MLLDYTPGDVGGTSSEERRQAVLTPENSTTHLPCRERQVHTRDRPVLLSCMLCVLLVAGAAFGQEDLNRQHVMYVGSA